MWSISAANNSSNNATSAYFGDDNTGDNNYEAPPYQASVVQSPETQSRFVTAANFPVIEVLLGLIAIIVAICFFRGDLAKAYKPPGILLG